MNFLVITLDHQRFDAFGCRGNHLAHTPNLDALLAESMDFTNCYTQAPVCSPARHSMATGRYCHAHGVILNEAMPFSGLHTIAHALKPLGYRRFNQGHVHWRDFDMDNGYEGFWSARGDDFVESLSPAAQRRHEWEYQDITRRQSGGPSPRNREEYWGHDVAQTAIRQMREAVDEGKPFLCWTGFTEPHPPFYPPRDLYERTDQATLELPTNQDQSTHPYVAKKQQEWQHLTEVEKRQVLAGYYGMVALADEYVGKVLRAIRELGVEDETTVILTSDHGDQMWEHDLITKFVMFESSVHVPFAIRVPGQSGGTNSAFVEHVDMFPTICDLAGTPIPVSVQGRSLQPLLSGETPDDWRDAVFSQMGGMKMIRTEKWKLNVYDDKAGELYNCETI